MQTRLMGQYNGKWPVSLVFVSKPLITEIKAIVSFFFPRANFPFIINVPMCTCKETIPLSIITWSVISLKNYPLYATSFHYMISFIYLDNRNVSMHLFLRIHLYLTIIPRARMGSESIAHEAECRMDYWLRGHEGKRKNCFSKLQLVGLKNIETKHLSQVKASL